LHAFEKSGGIMLAACYVEGKISGKGLFVNVAGPRKVLT